MPITKDFKTIDEQINILKSRGLKIGNEQKAKNILKKYNYFDVINGFESFFLETASPKTYKNTLFTDFYFGVLLFTASAPAWAKGTSPEPSHRFAVPLPFREGKV